MTAITRKTVKIISHSSTHFHFIPVQVSYKHFAIPIKNHFLRESMNLFLKTTISEIYKITVFCNAVTLSRPLFISAYY